MAGGQEPELNGNTNLKGTFYIVNTFNYSILIVITLAMNVQHITHAILPKNVNLIVDFFLPSSHVTDKITNNLLNFTILRWFLINVLVSGHQSKV